MSITYIVYCVTQCDMSVCRLLFVCSSNIVNITKITNDKFETLYKWLSKDKLSINIDKLKFICINSTYKLQCLGKHTVDDY